MQKLNILVFINERLFFYDVKPNWIFFAFRSKIGCMFWHVIQLFPTVHDKHIKRNVIINGAMENVESLARSQYMDDEVGLLSSSAPFVGLQSLEVNCLHIILDLNGIFVVTSFEKIRNMGVVTQNQRPPTLIQTVVLRPKLKGFLQRCMG